MNQNIPFWKKIIVSFFKSIGFDIKRTSKAKFEVPKDFDSDSNEIYQKVKDLTLIPPERIISLIQSIKYIEDNNIEGDYVECGVYMGGVGLAIALTLEKFYPDSNRKIWLYDTFSGMSMPNQYDVKQWFDSSKGAVVDSGKAIDKINRYNITANSSDWTNCSLKEVKNNIFSNTSYSHNNFNFIEGKVQDTIPLHSPDKIALLRLDTDFYESTKHELIHLYPALEIYGILIIDDYGIWSGCQKAVDEYISEKKIKIFLSRIDYSSRAAIKIH
jgi:O-methyltransferase